ncbi:hypothetical protein SEA_JORGENSEN_85 [Mycobacterium phage Jorgensen]|nr:hypothetical protein SEA_JORGENSEN_85 [Mycobacterium phage Jorgensen]
MTKRLAFVVWFIVGQVHSVLGDQDRSDPPSHHQA